LSIRYRVIVTAVLMAVLFLGTSALAERQWIDLGQGPEKGVEVTVLEAEPARTVVEFRLGGYWLDEVEIEGRMHAVIGLPGRTTLMNKGYPDLPKIRERLVVPDDAHMTIRVLESDQMEMATLPVVPSKGHLTRNIDHTTVPYEFNPVYGTDAWYPQRTAWLDEPFIVRDLRGVSMQINPIQYNPARGNLRFYSRIVVEVSSDGPGRTNIKTRTKSRERIDADFDAMYQRFFLNYSAVKYTPVLEQGRMLIICYNGFAADIQPFYEWKLQKGIDTKLALYPDSTGSGNTAIKTYIQNMYDSPEGLTYIMLVGDAAQIPTNTGTAEGADSDPCYVKLEGGDHYPDAFISRLSATTSAHVDNQVDKFINYELNPDTGGTAAWYHKACGIASDDDGGTGMADWERMDVLRTILLGYTYTEMDQIYDPGASASQVTTAVNDGRGFINYIGHGSGTSWSTTGFSNSHVNALSNGSMLPFICDVACVNGYFTMGGDCFAEAWLKAGSAGSPKGAVAHYAASTNASWIPPVVMQREVVDLLVGEVRNTFGGLCFNGVMKGMDENPGYEGTKLMEQYHIFGDCSAQMRSDVPASMAVNHDAVIFVDAVSFDVQVPGVEGALAALYDNGILYGSALTNASGNATIMLTESFPAPGQVTLTVTGYNKVPYVATLDVVTPSGPYMVYDAHGVDDVAGGNGDGVVNPGETIEMPVILRNAGSDPATAVSAILKLDDPYVTITDNSEDYGDVPAESTATSYEDYDFTVTGDCPDGYVLSFRLDITSAETTWTAFAPNIAVAAPDLAYLSHLVDDSAGNGNGQPDPGETFDMTVTLKNHGSGAAAGVSAMLSSGSPYVTVTVNSASYGGIPADGSAASATAYTLVADPGCPSGHTAPLYLNISAAAGYSASDTFQVSIGQRPILLVDDDDGASYQSYWISALDAGGYAYEVWNLASKGSPPADSLNQYRIILWTTADDYGYSGSPTTLTSTDQANLMTYLDNGGNLFLSSQDLLYDNSPNTFITDYLHVADHDDDVSPTQETGIAGDPISDGMVLGLSFPFSNWGDNITPGAGATRLFRNSSYSLKEIGRDGTPMAQDQIKGGPARADSCGALRYPASGTSTYKVVFFAFAFEAISTTQPDPNNQETVLANILDWFIGDQIPPSTVGNMAAVLEGGGLHLSWSPATDSRGVDHYVVYRGTQPDFLPGSGDSIGSTADTFFVDPGSAVGDTLLNHYYSIKAVDGAGNKSAPSGHCGEFDRFLVPSPPDTARAR
jgi:hypothetical protein